MSADQMRSTLAAVMLLPILLLVGCESAEHKVEREHEQRAVKTENEIGVLRSRYNPVTEWPGQLKNTRFSIDIKPIFVRSDQRPMLFYGSLEDVRQEGDVLLLYFEILPTEHEPTLQLVMDCAGCDVNKLRTPDKALGDFAVVARIVSAEKVINGPEDGPDYELRGTFVDALFVADYAFDKALKLQR